MTALAAKTLTPEAPVSKQKAENKSARAALPTSIAALFSAPMIQRKAACACGGDCPRCRDAPIQTKLSVSHPGDQHEKEADHIAEQVMRMPAHLPAHEAKPLSLNQEPAATLQRKCSGCEEEDEKRLSRKKNELASAQEPPRSSSLVSQTLSSQGQPLDAATRSFFEPRFGRDFGDVRIHSDASAAESAQSVNAQAYTVGKDVVFGKEKYRPQTDEGRHLLAHELAHVVQQSAHGTRLQRRDDKTKPAPAKKPKEKFKGTAGSAPKLELDNSATTPCACLMVIHNNEKNARRTAEAIHKHCSYNLLLLNPNDGERRLSLPGHTETTDPNELFTAKVAEDCVKDEKQCEDFVKANSGTSDPALVEEVMGKQFYLAISK